MPWRLYARLDLVRRRYWRADNPLALRDRLRRDADWRVNPSRARMLRERRVLPLLNPNI